MVSKYKISVISILLVSFLLSSCASKTTSSNTQTIKQAKSSTVVKSTTEVGQKLGDDEGIDEVELNSGKEQSISEDDLNSGKDQSIDVTELSSDNEEITSEDDLNSGKDQSTDEAEINSGNEESTGEIELNSSNVESIDDIYHDLYIGEAFKSGYAYIEPFQYDRYPFYESIIFQDWSDSIKFHLLDGSNSIYEATFDSESSTYIPSIEEDSQYFWQSMMGESDQFTLCYKTDGNVKDHSIGISFMNYKISKIDFTDMGKDRVYSEEEYEKSVLDVEKSIKEQKELDGTLSERTVENSLVGAKQICLIKLKDTSYELLLSKYFYLGFESTADVYVIDFLDEEGNVIKTFVKSNGVAY